MARGGGIQQEAGWRRAHVSRHDRDTISKLAYDRPVNFLGGSAVDTNDILRLVIEGLTYDTLKKLSIAFVVTLGGHLIFRAVTDRLRERKEIVLYWVGGFALVMTLLIQLGSKPHEPQLTLGIATAMSGPMNDGRDTAWVLTVSMLNSGTMQSIAKDWTVEASVNGTKYPGAFMIPAPTALMIR